MTFTHQNADDALPSSGWVWVHTGDPGAASTANVAQLSAANIVRKEVTFGSPGNHPTNDERRVLSTSAAEWSGEEIDASQALTHFSIWSAATDGTPLHVAELTGSPTTGSDGARFDSGDLECAVSVHVKP